MGKNEVRETKVLACLLLYLLNYKSFPEIRRFNSSVIFTAHFASLNFPPSFISDRQCLFKYCITKFFWAKGFSLVDLGFDYKVYGSSWRSEKFLKGRLGLLWTNLVYSLLNIFMRSIEKWGNTPLLMPGVDEVIPTCMVCKAISDMQVH